MYLLRLLLMMLSVTKPFILRANGIITAENSILEFSKHNSIRDMQMLPDTSGVLRIPGTGYQVVHRRGSATRRADASHFSRAYIDIIRHADAVEREVVPIYPALQREAVRFGLYERLDYLLHVPIEDMNPQNSFYADVCRYLKDHFKEMLQSPWLTGKNKLYLTLLTAAPKTVRRVHRMLRGKKLQ